MGKIHIITDSASDLSEQFEKEHDIRVIPYSFAMADQVYTSRIDFNPEQFYQLLADHPDEIPKTSQITPFQFMEIYEEEFQAGYTDIIMVLINSKGSATYGNAMMALDDFYEEHPERKGVFRIYLFDGGSYTGAYGYPVMQAAHMLADGKSCEEITEYLGDVIPKRRIYFGMYSLKYAGKSGRIPSAAALVGDKLNIKPVMKIYDHEITTAVKCRGENKMIAKIVEQTVADMVPGSEYQIVYGSDTECRDVMIRKMTEAVGYPPVESFQIGVEVATNAGPKVVGTIFNI